jgi:lysozyme
MNLTKSIKGHEGFREYPYIDSLRKNNPEKYGIPAKDMKIIEKHFDKLKVTFGYGFTFITKEEATLVLNRRIKNVKKDLITKLEWVAEQPQEIQNVLVEMAYQMGVNGLLKFKNTLKYCEARDYKNMAMEMLNSHWAKIDTPARAKELSDIVANYKG